MATPATQRKRGAAKKGGTGKAAGKPAGKAAASAAGKAAAAPKPKRTKAQLEAAMEQHRPGYNAYVKARAEARKGTAGAAAEQEKQRPHYTEFKRAYTEKLALGKATSGGQG